VRRIAAVLLWSALSAAFIGPGTVTTAARAGASFRLELLWALLFSTITCWALQESAARLTIASGKTLGEALVWRFAGTTAAFVPWLAVGAVVLGCAAYQAGNILGAAAGAGLAVAAPVRLTAAACGLAVGAGLVFGTPRALALLLGVVVALMGVAFVVGAALTAPSPGEILAGSVVPRAPRGSGTLILGLIGTTVVPYNLFLGSGLARGRDLGETRAALGTAIGGGGLISMAILVVGTGASASPFSFASVADSLELRLGAWAGGLFATGLFAAGLSSALTAPLAAGLAAASVRRAGRPEHRTRTVVALAVLAFGLLFGLAEVKPIPVILLAQAVNGLLLPFVAVFLLLAVNDRALVGDGALSGALANTVCGIAVLATFVIGARALLLAAFAALGRTAPGEDWIVAAALAAAAALGWPIILQARRLRG